MPHSDSHDFQVVFLGFCGVAVCYDGSEEFGAFFIGSLLGLGVRRQFQSTGVATGKIHSRACV